MNSIKLKQFLIDPISEDKILVNAKWLQTELRALEVLQRNYSKLMNEKVTLHNKLVLARNDIAYYEAISIVKHDYTELDIKG